MRIEDIAKEAGVSTATVSRVLNNPGLVKQETLDKVLAVVNRNDYVPDSLARGLMTKKSGTVGVLIISISNAYYMEITETIQRRLRDAGLMMILGATDDSIDLEKRYILDFASRRVDGMILIDASHENFSSGLFVREAAKRPIVLVHSDKAIRGSGLNEVFLDQAQGMSRAMEHLWALGHRDVAFLRGIHGFSYDLKEDVWKDWYRDRDLPVREDRVLRIDDGNSEDAVPLAEEAVTGMLTLGPRPSAIFCCNDLQARGAVSAATRAGLRIPEDISLVSHDDTILAVSGRVQLTAVDLRMREVGRAASDLLLAALGGGPGMGGSREISPELVERDSTSRATR